MKSSRHSIGNGSSGFERLGEKELWKANVSAKTLTSRRKLSRALLAIVTSTTRAGSEKATAVAHAAGVSPATTCVAIARTTTIVALVQCLPIVLPHRPIAPAPRPRRGATRRRHQSPERPDHVVHALGNMSKFRRGFLHQYQPAATRR